MDNPSIILTAVDQRLNHQVRLVLYGRSAICLGFDDAPPETAETQDVDAIISFAQSGELEGDLDFWNAIEGANAELAAKGLYITHLFREQEIFLRTCWEKEIVPVKRPALLQLQLVRPATVDLVLTKMMRGRDPQDLADAKFMIEHDTITKMQLSNAFAQMKPIELVELRDAFSRAQPLILAMAK